MDRLRRLLSEESGPTAIEYGLIAALVSVVIIGALLVLGQALANVFETVADAVNNVAPAP